MKYILTGHGQNIKVSTIINNRKLFIYNSIYNELLLKTYVIQQRSTMTYFIYLNTSLFIMKKLNLVYSLSVFTNDINHLNTFMGNVSIKYTNRKFEDTK